MNTFTAIDVSYITPSRTIESILLQNKISKRLVYVYNYEGIHFRVFKLITDLIGFFNNQVEAEIEFESDEELDIYLKNLNINS
jgi:hypothetical protein